MMTKEIIYGSNGESVVEIYNGELPKGYKEITEKEFIGVKEKKVEKIEEDKEEETKTEKK